MLTLLWSERPLSLRDIIVDEHATQIAIGGREGQSPEVHNLEEDSPSNSPLKKKPKNRDTKLGLAKISLQDTLPRVQRILLQSTTYVRDAEMEIINLHAEFVVKDT
ncbi:hypothetical protein AHAS_Ahas15G0299500 [Arachis hypogaea]